MKPYSFDTRCNFAAHESFNINDLDLAKYTDIVYSFKSLCNIFGIGVNDCVAACRELKINNTEIFDIDYLPHEGPCSYALLLKKNCAHRQEQKDNRIFKVYYSAFVVNSQYQCYTSTLAEYFCRKNSDLDEKGQNIEYAL